MREKYVEYGSEAGGRYGCGRQVGPEIQNTGYEPLEVKKDHLSRKRRGRFIYILELIRGVIGEKPKRGVLTEKGKL